MKRLGEVAVYGWPRYRPDQEALRRAALEVGWNHVSIASRPLGREAFVLNCRDGREGRFVRDDGLIVEVTAAPPPRSGVTVPEFGQR